MLLFTGGKIAVQIQVIGCAAAILKMEKRKMELAYFHGTKKNALIFQKL